MLDYEDINNRFTYHRPEAHQVTQYQRLRAQGQLLAELIAEFCPDSRERSLAVTKVEEAIMWANAAIARQK